MNSQSLVTEKGFIFTHPLEREGSSSSTLPEIAVSLSGSCPFPALVPASPGAHTDTGPACPRPLTISRTPHGVLAPDDVPDPSRCPGPAFPGPRPSRPRLPAAAELRVAPPLGALPLASAARARPRRARPPAGSRDPQDGRRRPVVLMNNLCAGQRPRAGGGRAREL